MPEPTWNFTDRVSVNLDDKPCVFSLSCAFQNAECEIELEPGEVVHMELRAHK